MKTYTFTLIAEGPDLQTEEITDALFEADCDDALVGRADGIQFIDFDREAETLDQAVLSAIAAVETIDGVEIVRLADAGLISMADIASRTGRTRESVRLLVSGERGPGGFPPPITDPRSRYRLWRSSEVDYWFKHNLETDIENARDDNILVAINAGLELRRHRARISNQPKSDLQTLIGLAS